MQQALLKLQNNHEILQKNFEILAKKVDDLQQQIVDHQTRQDFVLDPDSLPAMNGKHKRLEIKDYDNIIKHQQYHQ